jgi:hypothetical protein
MSDPPDAAHWQRPLLARLERGMGRELLAADHACLRWNPAAGTLTVGAGPLLLELRGRSVTSNVFRGPPPPGADGRGGAS